MKQPSGILLWILIGAGAIFLYAAYKGHSPKDVIANVTGSIKR